MSRTLLLLVASLLLHCLANLHMDIRIRRIRNRESESGGLESGSLFQYFEYQEHPEGSGSGGKSETQPSRSGWGIGHQDYEDDDNYDDDDDDDNDDDDAYADLFRHLSNNSGALGDLVFRVIMIMTTTITTTITTIAMTMMTMMMLLF